MSKSIFTNQTPSLTDLTDATAYTLGTTFYVTSSGRTAVGVRWYFPATLPTGTVTAKLYRVSDQAELASATFSDPTAGSWNVALFAAAVSLTQNAAYIAAVHTEDRYVATVDFFDAQSVSNAPLMSPQDGTDPLGSGVLRNGILHVGSTPSYPDLQGGGACYFVDVILPDTVTGVASASLGSLSAPAEAAVSTPTPSVPVQSGWYGLLSISDNVRQNSADEARRQPEACPNDGEPLSVGPDGRLFCVYDGWTTGGMP